MAIFSKESLENLRQKVDLVEVLAPYMELKRAGAAYKGLCPFHDEKTPSFVVNKGDSFYHCFGCGAHGDAIRFLMNHSKISFVEAVETLAQRFHVPLEVVEGSLEQKGPNKNLLKSALEKAAQFYQFILLHTNEGHQALHYLYSRSIDLDFIRQFDIGLAPAQSGPFRSYMHSQGFNDQTLLDAGLLNSSYRDFFFDRITFPICNGTGSVIGFSCRKYKDSTYGGKYINTPETAVFKKSKVLFGIQYSRRRIAKERRAIIVEGQIDALKLIAAGLNFTVAGQGTAFGDDHAAELVNLGVQKVFLALDADLAGQTAASKIGNIFQKQGVEVAVVQMPAGMDPDSYLRANGIHSFISLLEKAPDYLTFQVGFLSKTIDISSPAGKSEMVQQLVKQIRSWEHPLMVHESLRKIAFLTNVPESMIGIGEEHIPNVFIKKSATLGVQTVDPDRILESDLLRWLLLMGHEQPAFIELAKKNISEQDFRVSVCAKLYKSFLGNCREGRPGDLLQLAIHMDDAEGQLVLSELLQKKINKEKAEEQFLVTLKKILDRNWMGEREKIRMKIQSGHCSEDEVLELVKTFDELKRNSPTIQR